MTNPYRTDQIGSLIRPPALLDARDAYKAGHIGLDELRGAEDAAILDALAMQQRIGVEIYSDGEMRRDSWQTNFSEAVAGFEKDYPVREFRKPDGTAAKVEMHTKAVAGKLRSVRRLAEVDARFMREHSPGPFKITMPSPSYVAWQSYRTGFTEQAYPTRQEMHRDLVAIVSSEMRALASEGAAYLQLDEGFTRYVDDGWRERLKEQGLDPVAVLQGDIAADNECYDAVRRDGVTVAMHLCRGSRMSWQRGTGGYDWLAEQLFDALHVDRFLLEYDSDRVGGFEPLRFLPKGKVAVLGLVSSTDPVLESRDTLLRRIEQAAKFCPIEQLAISTQCGFQGAADRDGAHMTIDEEQRKLELIVSTAVEIWH
jgi:5-methyltetrahydropteroyltriglutamate--homocysteine methyltransferase